MLAEEAMLEEIGVESVNLLLDWLIKEHLQWVLS